MDRVICDRCGCDIARNWLSRHQRTRRCWVDAWKRLLAEGWEAEHAWAADETVVHKGWCAEFPPGTVTCLPHYGSKVSSYFYRSPYPQYTVEEIVETAVRVKLASRKSMRWAFQEVKRAIDQGMALDDLRGMWGLR